MEHNVNRTKAEELAREHSRVDELAESVENDTLIDGAVMASRLHHCDAGMSGSGVKFNQLVKYLVDSIRFSKICQDIE